MFRIHLRQLGTTAVSVVALMTMALIAPGAAFAQKTIIINAIEFDNGGCHVFEKVAVVADNYGGK